MTLTITLSDDIESRLRAAAEAEGTDKETVAARVLAEAFGMSPIALEEDPDDPDAIREIGEALAEMEAAEARGDYGRPIEEFWTQMEAETSEKDALRS